MDKTFTVSKDERTHDESGRGLEMGFYFVCYGSTRLRQRPDNAYARAKRLMAQGWTPADESTRSFVDGMRNVVDTSDLLVER